MAGRKDKLSTVMVTYQARYGGRKWGKSDKVDAMGRGGGGEREVFVTNLRVKPSTTLVWNGVRRRKKALPSYFNFFFMKVNPHWGSGDVLQHFHKISRAEIVNSSFRAHKRVCICKTHYKIATSSLCAYMSIDRSTVISNRESSKIRCEALDRNSAETDWTSQMSTCH